MAGRFFDREKWAGVTKGAEGLGKPFLWADVELLSSQKKQICDTFAVRFYGARWLGDQMGIRETVKKLKI